MATGTTIGDAVLHFLVDLTQLDQLEARLGALPSKLNPADAAISSVGTNFEKAGKSAASAGSAAVTAGEKITSAGRPAAASFKEATAQVDGFARSMAVGQQGAVQLGTVTDLAGNKARESMYQARGEAGLLGEAFGVKLPRHVRSFIAELPGIGTALSAAFQATAVLFIIEAVIQLGEKLHELLKSEDEVAKAWQGVEDSGVITLRKLGDEVLQDQIKIDDLTKNHLAALRDQLTLIDHASLSELGDTFTELAKQADAAFDKMSGHPVWDLLVKGIVPGSVSKAHEELDRFNEQFNRLVNQGNRQQAMQELGAEILKVKDRLSELDEKRRKTDEDERENVDTQIAAYRQLYATVIRMSDAFDTVGEHERKQAEIAKDETLSKELSDALIKVRETLEQSLAVIERYKQSQHLLFAEGIISAGQWAIAQRNAADAALFAQSKYQDNVLETTKRLGTAFEVQRAIATRATEETKLQNKSVDELATAIEKHREGVRKLRDEWLKLQEASVGKLFEEAQKAAEQLTKAEERLNQAQKNLEESTISKAFSEQAAAFDKLAQLGVISEERKARLLRALYAQEEAQALKALHDLLTKEKAVLDQAQNNFDLGKKNPFFTDAQKIDLEKNLDEAKARVLQTEAQITKTEQDAQNKQLSVSRDHYSRALALAVASGNGIIAAKLRENHAALLVAEAELAEAKARGANTKAIEQEIKSLQHLEKELSRDAAATKQVNADVDELKNTMQQAAVGELKAFGDAMAAAIAGQESFGAAMISGTLRVISQIAQQWAEYYFAMAIADFFWNPARAAGELAAAIALEAVAGATSGGASAIDSGAQSGSQASPTGTESPVAGSPAVAAGQQPVQVQNVQHFSKGGTVVGSGDSDSVPALLTPGEFIVKAPAVRMVGAEFLESLNRGMPHAEMAGAQFPRAALAAGREAMSLVRDSSTQSREISSHQDNRIHIHVEMPVSGVWSDNNIDKLAPKLAKEISRQVSSGATRLKASTSYRVTKRG